MTRHTCADDEFPPSRIIGSLGGGTALAIFAMTCAERANTPIQQLADKEAVRSAAQL
jgi:hypothetical protein